MRFVTIWLLYRGIKKRRTSFRMTALLNYFPETSFLVQKLFDFSFDLIFGLAKLLL